MNEQFEQFYQSIGSTALAMAGGPPSKLLLCAEVEDGAISCDVFWTVSDDQVALKFASKSLQNLVYKFWEQWKDHPDNHEWRVLEYVVSDGKFKADLAYPDQLDPKEHYSDRRPKIIRKHFGEIAIDYSNPE